MLTLAIVEDDPVCAAQLKENAERFCREHDIALQLTMYTDGLEIAEHYRPVWDAIFLDIKMEHLDGMAAAQRIREQDPTVLILFITSMARYAIHGYSVEALDFVLKPVNYPKLAMRMRKIVDIVASREGRSIMISEDGNMHRIPSSQILYIEVANRHLHIHTPERVFVTNGALSRLEQQLEGLPFARCSQSYLVNLHYVRRIEKNTVLVQDDALPVSRSKQKSFLNALSDYVGGGFR